MTKKKKPTKPPAKPAAPAAEPARDWLTTGELAARYGLPELRVQTILRSTPGLRPQVVARMRRWYPADVAAFHARLVELGDRAAGRGGAS